MEETSSFFSIPILDLPIDVVGVIAEKLPDDDFGRFCLTCNTTKALFHRGVNRQPPPILMTSLTGEPDVDPEYFTVQDQQFQPFPKRVRHFHFRDGMSSSQGWLLYSIDPATGFEICDPFDELISEYHLPVLGNGFLLKAVLSKDSNPGNFLVLGTSDSEFWTLMSYNESINPTAWDTFDIDYGASIEDIVHARGKFFMIDTKGVLYYLDLNMDPIISSFSLPLSYLPSFSLSHHYIVESCSLSKGDVKGVRSLYAVKRTWGTSRLVTVKFEVFEYDERFFQWREVEDLMGCTLFVGNNTSVCIIASLYPGFRPNSIYFTEAGLDFGGSNVHDMGIYCLDDHTIMPYFPEVSNRNFPAPIWITRFIHQQ